MRINYKYLGSIKFPVYALPNDNWHSQDGLLFLGHRVLDDKNQIGSTLGQRRLQTPHKLFRLNKSCDTFGEMIASKKAHFIDMGGRPFTYEKTMFTKVSYHKIQKVQTRETGTVIQAKDVPFPMVFRRPPPPAKTWIAMLYFKGVPWMPYEFAENKSPDFRRKI